MTADRAVPVATEEVIVTLGAQGALYSVLQCLLDPGDEVVACDPFYVTYLETARAAGAALVAAPLDVARGFAVDVDAIAARITPRTRALLLNTPNNPTGATIDAAAWAAIAELAEAHDLWIVSDEVYGGLVFDGRHVSALDLARARPQLRDRIAIIDSLSKSHAMTGWRIGWTIGPADLIARIDALGVCLHYGLPGFVQDAAITAIAARGRVTPSIRETYRSRRELLCEALSGARGLRARPPSAGMFVMLDVRDTGLSSRDFAMRLLEEAGVTLMPGESFGAAARGFLRVSLAADEGALKEAAARIRRFADTL